MRGSLDVKYVYSTHSMYVYMVEHIMLQQLLFISSLLLPEQGTLSIPSCQENEDLAEC